MPRKDQKAESLERYPHRCPAFECGRVAKYHVGPERTLACNLHVGGAIRRVIESGTKGTVVEVTAVEGQF